MEKKTKKVIAEKEKKMIRKSPKNGETRRKRAKNNGKCAKNCRKNDNMKKQIANKSAKN